jgi:hypothetical protein
MSTGSAHPPTSRRAQIGLRFDLLGQSLVLVSASLVGVVLFFLWFTAVALVGIGVGVPATLLLTVLVRWLADRHREWATNRLGKPIDRPYGPAPDGNWLTQTWAILRDPATWRDWAWLVVNAVTGWFTTGLSLLFFLAGVFYLLFPLVYRLTPPEVFRTPLGEGFRLHSVTQSFALVPLGLLLLLLWWATARGWQTSTPG